MKKKILFLCTGNSCRSQMAEGLAKKMISNEFDVYSAGIKTHGINPYAVKAMAEMGIDISQQKSQLLSEFDKITFDYVITLCSHAHENCPIFDGETTLIHHPFDDPPKLAEKEESERAKLVHYIRVRDEIQSYIKELPKQLLAVSAS